MMLRNITIFLFGAAAVTVALPVSALAADSNQDYRRKVIGISRIMNNTSTGMDCPVTRAQYARMLVNASSLRDSVPALSRVSVYADIPMTSEYASYIRTAAQQKWMTGYLGGQFKPDQPVTLNEAVRGILALLGYTDEDFSESLSDSRMTLFYSLELDDELGRQPEEILNREDCVNLFYNLLKTEMKSGGKVYGTVLGCEVNSDGEINPMALADASLRGPKVIPKGKQLGDYVTIGTPIFRIQSKDAADILQTYKDALDTAQERLESAQSKMDSTQEEYENYTITAPISGQVITKSIKTGDKVSRNASGSETAMAVIYDMSGLTFEMSVDELDVQSVQVGQRVEVTADAVEGQTFAGTVTNISLESSQSNGVTNYPVTVTLEEGGGLLPGMNVDGGIILEEAEDVLIIPVDALMRGNRVYVQDSSVTESQGNVPAGFRSVEVETGLSNDSYVQIVSGLSEGDVVYLDQASQTDTDSFPMREMPGGGMPGGNGGGNRGSARGFGDRR